MRIIQTSTNETQPRRNKMFAFPNTPEQMANYIKNRDETDYKKSIARQELDELNRQAAKQSKSVFSGKLISNDQLNNALDANS